MLTDDPSCYVAFPEVRNAILIATLVVVFSVYWWVRRAAERRWVPGPRPIHLRGTRAAGCDSGRRGRSESVVSTTVEAAQHESTRSSDVG